MQKLLKVAIMAAYSKITLQLSKKLFFSISIVVPNGPLLRQNFEFLCNQNLHFSCHRERRKTDLGMSTPQRLHCVPLQLLHKQRVEEPAIRHPTKYERERDYSVNNIT